MKWAVSITLLFSFQGKIFYITPGVIPNLASMKEIIEHAGGTVERHRRSLKQILELNNRVIKPYQLGITLNSTGQNSVPNCTTPDGPPATTVNSSSVTTPTTTTPTASNENPLLARVESKESKTEDPKSLNGKSNGKKDPVYVVISTQNDMHLISDLMRANVGKCSKSIVHH